VDGSTLGLIEMLLVLGIVLGLGIWQLVSVRRELKRDREKSGRSDS
jgi:cytochrome oxidase assembly protein ShyY1